TLDTQRRNGPGPEPTLVRAISPLTGNAVRFVSKPKLPLTGSTVAPGAIAAPAFSLPAPAAVGLAGLLPSSTFGLAVFTSADLIWNTFMFGLRCMTRAAAPPTSAFEKLVPSSVANPVGANSA